MDILLTKRLNMSRLLALAIMVWLTANPVLAVDDLTIEGIVYHLQSNGQFYSVVGLTDTMQVVDIRDRIGNTSGLYVKKIMLNGNCPLQHSTVYCPKMLNEIGEKCFANSDIEHISFDRLSNNVELKIGSEAFMNSKLREITLPSKVYRVSEYAFSGCDSLRKVVLTPNITQIEQFAFQGCPITEIKLPDGVTSVAAGAFLNCPLQHVWLSSGLETLGRAAFCASDTVDVQHIYVPTGELATCHLLAAGVNGSFHGREDVVVHIPVGTIKLFEKSEAWNSYTLQEDEALGHQCLVSFSTTTPDSAIVWLERGQQLNDSTYLVNYGQDVVLCVQPIDGCHLRCCTVNGLDISHQIDEEGRCTLEDIKQDMSIFYSSRSQTLVPITIRQGGGAVTVQVYRDEPIKLNVKADQGWTIHSVTVNGKDVTKKLDGNGDFTIYKVNGSIVVGSTPIPVDGSEWDENDDGQVIETFVAFKNNNAGMGGIVDSKLRVYGTSGQLHVDGAQSGELITVCDVSGRVLTQCCSQGFPLVLEVSTGVYIVQVGTSIFKIAF